MSTTLPPDLISDILCGLPVKSLLRFRSTSNEFCSTIDDPHFTELHLHRSAQTRSHRSLILTGNPLLSVDLDSLDRSVEIEHPMKNPERDTEVIGSCNGLLCLLNSDAEIVIWNKSTGKHHRVPYVAIDFPAGAAVHEVGYGFGHDSNPDDYKLMRIVRFRHTVNTEVMVYSLKSNSWKKIEGLTFPFDFSHPPLVRPICVFADGVLHWPVRVYFQSSFRVLICGFNLAAEKFMFVPLPPVEQDEEIQVGLWEGHFCVICHCIGKSTNMYVMEDKCWTHPLSTSQPGVTGSSGCVLPGCVLPVAHSGNGNEVLILKDNEKFLWYDLKSNKVKNVRIRGLPYLFDAHLYVESLVSPLPLVNGAVAKRENPERDDFLSTGFKLKL